MTELMGTPGAGLVTGVRVFHHTGPTATSFYTAGDTGTVYVANPDGRGYFTATDQPFFKYDEILTPGDTSGVKTWHWYVPPQVKTFSFTVMVEAALPSETALPSVPPTTFQFPNDTITNPITEFGPGARYYSTYVGMKFDDTTSLVTYYRVVQKHNATLVAGSPTTNEYVFRIPNTGTTFASFGAKLDSISAEPGLTYAYPLAFWRNTKFHSRSPDDVGLPQEAYFDGRVSSSPMLSIRAPLGWGCEAGLYGGQRPAVGILDWRPEMANGSCPLRLRTSESPREKE